VATSPTVSFDPSGFERSTTCAIASALRVSVPVRTRACPPRLHIAGRIGIDLGGDGLRDLAMVMSWRIRLTDGTSITVSGAATPRIVVRVTPASNSRITSSSAKAAS
jgi:hypothetical protein